MRLFEGIKQLVHALNIFLKRIKNEANKSKADHLS